MSYPDYPQNRLIVDGVDLSIRFQMILLDGYTLSPPEPKTYTVDIPGGDGVIDLTQSLTGDVVYNNRQQEFPFMVVNPESFETVKTKVSNFLHGKAFDYQMTMDPGYTYHGRFTVNEYSHALYAYPGLVGVFTIAIDAEPYKLKKHMVYKLNATGGQSFRLESGRKPVHPTIECSQPCKVTWNNIVTQVPTGTYRLNDILFTEGFNEIYINSFEFFTLTWGDIDQGGSQEMTWDEASQYRWDDLQRLGGDGYEGVQKWIDLSQYRWSDLATRTWKDLDLRASSVTETSIGDNTVYIKYDWKDL